MGDDDAQRYTMLFCDSTTCYVNTFEYGDGGQCPGCGRPGDLIPARIAD